MPGLITRAPIAVFALLAAVLSGAALAAPKVPTNAADVTPVKSGQPAPAFEARTASGEPFSFKPKQLERPTMLIFYRGGWCPYCNAHLGELRKVEAELKTMGFDVLFLSADRPELLKPSLKEQDLNYTLLSDARMDAARAFGIAFRVDDATIEKYKQYNIDLEAASGEKHHELPVPAVFIVDAQGVVRFAHFDPDYTVRLSGEKILEAARRIESAGGTASTAL